MAWHGFTDLKVGSAFAYCRYFRTMTLSVIPLNLTPQPACLDRRHIEVKRIADARFCETARTMIGTEAIPFAH
jgi:hypothetical protein